MDPEDNEVELCIEGENEGPADVGGRGVPSGWT